MAASGFTVLQHVVPATFIRERRRSTIGKSDSLSLAVKQYKWNGDVSDRSTPITVIGAHANAFPKVYLNFLYTKSMPFIADTIG